jgi:hypothetical protein
MSFASKIAVFLLCLSALAGAQKTGKSSPEALPVAPDAPANTAAEDISGMYSFLKDGEFLQINLDANGVTGVISRQGEQESDRGQFLDLVFTSASVHGHDVAFTTRRVHGVSFEFKGRFERGRAKDKTQDGFYLLSGTLTEFTTDANKKTTSRSRAVELKWLGQPDDGQPAKSQ